MTAAGLQQPFDAFVVQKDGTSVKCGVVKLRASDLPTGSVLVKVGYSSINYKDALASTAAGKVARISPLVPGIDLVGTVVRSDSSSFQPGQEVIAHGYGIGVSWHGGFSRYASLPAEWVLSLPAGLDQLEAMTLGTAGFTAAMSVAAIQDHGCLPGAGKVLVTGASGGVGSLAVAMLAQSGYHVVASTGTSSTRKWLLGLGAQEVVDRDYVAAFSARALSEETWQAAVDCTGGATLAGILSSMARGGVVAASGMTAGSKLDTTVFPFILRGVSLLGMDSAEMAMPKRKALWQRLASDLKPQGLKSLGKIVDLAGLSSALDALLENKNTGRMVVALGD